MARRDQTLYRDESDKMLGGVCSGIGRYFDVDTTLVRVAFVVLAVVAGGGVLAYLILWIVLDPAPPGAYDDPIDLTEVAEVSELATDGGPATESAPAAEADAAESGTEASTDAAADQTETT